MLAKEGETSHFMPKAQSWISRDTKTVSTKNAEVQTELLPFEKKIEEMLLEPKR